MTTPRILRPIAAIIVDSQNRKEEFPVLRIPLLSNRAPDRAQTNTFYLIDFEKFIQIEFPKLQKFLQNRFNERWLI